MKKIISLIVSLLTFLSLVGCSNSPKIGDITVNSNNDFEVKLISAEFVDEINMDENDENFFMPTISDKTKQTLKPSNGEALFHYTCEYKYIGTKELKDRFHDYAKPILIYDKEYHFNENYCSVRNVDSKWYYLSSDIDAEFFKVKNGIKNTVFYDSTYKPLDDTTYQVRGFISVPEKVKNEPKSLEFCLYLMGQKYIIE
ncbi:MAG: hypothetical protein E7417_00125 [Ruminococcaceae bacterium]|nr:hypothetical protein [Oscillospiraceae bacterium]